MLFTRNNLGVRHSNRKIWFKKWVLDKRNLKDLSQDSGYSVSTLKRHFNDYLLAYPRLSVFPSERVNLLIDGTYFRNNLCLIVYRDNTIKFTQLYRLTDGEWYDEMKEDLENLIRLGVNIESITCDGHKSLLKAIRTVCTEITVQRCIIHIQRMCRIWLSEKPKSEAGIELRQIVSKLHLINTQYEKGYWIVSLVRWYEKYESFVNQKTYNQETGRFWYTHKMVRRSFSVIRKALPDMFHYLDNRMIPKSTNGLESFFGHLKGNLDVHRGLSIEHRKNFIRWYLYYRNKETERFSEP